MPEPDILQLLGGLRQELVHLAKQLATLAAAELREMPTRIARDALIAAAGGAVLVAGLLALAAVAVIGLARYMPWWAAALVGGVVLSALGAVLVVIGLRRLACCDMVPRRTIESVKETARWLHGKI